MSDIAVSVLGGYLGAGKTTLLNHILRTADERIAVLVNDFGDINIDEALIESNDGDTIALSNGCICCSLIDGFGAALNTISEFEPQPERLVIEASGVADPATVAAWGHSPGFTLDATVVVADAETIVSKADDRYVGDTIRAQLRSADIIVLNKRDLVDANELAERRRWIEEFCSEAAIVTTEQAEVDSMLLFGIAPRTNKDDPANIHADEIFSTWDWTSHDGAVSRVEIEARMNELPDSVVRCKGFLWLDDAPDHRMILQRVGKRWSMRRGPEWGPQVRYSQLVFIGVKS